MLSREIPRLYDNISDPPPQQYGAYYARYLNYVMNNDIENVQPLCILRSFSKYAPYCYQSIPRYRPRMDGGLGIYQTPAQCFSEEVHGIQGVIFLNSYFYTRYPSPHGGTNFVGTGKKTNMSSGDVTIITGTTYSLEANVIVGFDRSKYVLVPYITAINDNAREASFNINTYIQNMTSYPYITAVAYHIRYKSDLSSNSTGTDTNFAFVYSGSTYRTYAGDTSNQNNNNYQNYYEVPSIYLNSRYLFVSPTISGRRRSIDIGGQSVYFRSYVSGSQYDYSNRADEAKATHSIDICNYIELTPDNIYDYTPRYYITLDTLEKILNTTGFIWANSENDVADYHGKNTTSNNIHVPQVGTDGTTTENSWKGADIFDNWDLPNTLSWESDITSVDMNAPVDQPSDIKPLDPNTSELEPTTPLLNGLGVFASYYALNNTNVLDVSDFLWNADETVIDDVINSLKLFGANPVNAIMSLRLYPFNIASLIDQYTTEHIILGRIDTEVYGIKIPNNAKTTIDLGSMYIKPHFNDFRDYAPYSSYNVYIPFIGTVTINPNDYLGRVLSIKMVVDLTTGKATAILYAEGIPMQYLDGMIGVDIPITSENMAQTAAAVISAVGYTAGAVGAAATGNVGAAAGMIATGITDVLFNDVSITKTGNVSPAASLSMPINAYMVVSRPNVVIPANYGHTKGYACDMKATVSGLDGFTVCHNVDTSGITATEKERNEIKTLMEGGIYL